MLYVVRLHYNKVPGWGAEIAGIIPTNLKFVERYCTTHAAK